MPANDIENELIHLTSVFCIPTNSRVSEYRKTFDEFLREQEFGLALHAVCDYLTEIGAPIDSSLAEQLEHLHEAMQIKDDCLIQLRGLSIKS